MAEFLMPSLGADMEAGTVIEWRVAPGDTVQRGDIIAVVDTDKADIEVEVFESGVVEELLVPTGTRVPVGTPLARLCAQVAAPVDRAGPSERVRATPHARRLAGEQGIDLAAVRGTGPGGAVRAADLVGTPGAPLPPVATGATPSPPPPPPTAREGDRQETMRRAIGSLMARSKREIPHYYVATTIDLGPALDWLTERNAGRPVTERVLPAALLLRATALAARQVPELNGHWDAEAGVLRSAEHVHLGVAVALRGSGLIAPAISCADELALDELMAAMRAVVDRARAGNLRSSDMSEPTLTVTNLGDDGADEVQGVIYPPQVALVGFGRIARRPWAEGTMLGVRPTVRATLAGDHRATDGRTGSRMLAAINRLLQTPEAL